MSGLDFSPITLFSPGDLASIIGRSYAALVAEDPVRWAAERGSWEEFDRRVFAAPDTVGRCVFISRLGPEPVGLASFDPRPGPAYGLVGQNCVLPEYRGRGFGKDQIIEVLARLRDRGVGAARVTTSGHPFFRPALEMYRGLGFREVRRYPGGPDPRYPLIDLEKDPLVED